MSFSLSFFNRAISFILCWFILAPSGLLADERDSESDKQNIANIYRREYREILRKERQLKDDQRVAEDVASGVAAMVIGLYGYYNDDRGILTKIAYNATMTAGIILVSDTILAANKPSTLLLTDRYLRKKGRIDRKRYRRGIVSITRRSELAELKQTAYTSGILGSIYLYNAYREDIKSLKNVYYFLSFNFLLVSGASFYKSSVFTVRPSDQLSLDLLPMPRLTYNF